MAADLLLGAQPRGQKRVRRKLYAMMYNVCMLFVLGFDLLYNKVPCQMQYVVLNANVIDCKLLMNMTGLC